MPPRGAVQRQLLSNVKRRPSRLQRPSTAGSLFRVKPLTAMFSATDLNAQASAKLATAAQAPSLLYWLWLRCGVSLEEGAALAENKRILMNGQPVVERSELMAQRHWKALAAADVQIVTDTGRRVAAAHRALHRRYELLHVKWGTTHTNDELDPRSFRHLLREVHPIALPRMNLLEPAGFANKMGGLAIATNDALTWPLWVNDALGNFGVYESRFIRGTPPEEMSAIAQFVNLALSEANRGLMSSDVSLPNEARLERVDGERDDCKRPAADWDPTTKLVIRTSSFPATLWRRVRAITSATTLVGMGPFTLPSNLGPGQSRLLTNDELRAFFLFERRLKTNRVVYSLREFNDTHE